MFTSAKETKDVNQFLYFEPAEGRCRDPLMEPAPASLTVTFDPERLRACPGWRRCRPGSSCAAPAGTSSELDINIHAGGWMTAGINDQQDQERPPLLSPRHLLKRTVIPRP